MVEVQVELYVLRDDGEQGCTEVLWLKQTVNTILNFKNQWRSSKLAND